MARQSRLVAERRFVIVDLTEEPYELCGAQRYVALNR